MTDGDRASYEETYLSELVQSQREIRYRDQRLRYERVVPCHSYRLKLGQVTIRLGLVEFRILRFLAARPYQAFTRQRIARAVSTSRHPVQAETLDEHIDRLRAALGFFRDYIQSVPYVGYRFRE